MLHTTEIGPFAVQFNRFVKRHTRQICSNRADVLGRDAAAFFYRFGGIIVAEIFVGHQVEHRAVRDALGAVRARKIRLNPLTVPRGKLARATINHLRLTFGVAQKQPVLLGFWVLVYQHRGIGEASEVIEINFARFHQAMHQRQNKLPVGAGCNANPIVRHRVITSADRVHANHPRAACLDLADAHFDRVAVVVFGDTKQHEQLGMIPVRLAKFPERATHRIDARSGHVDRTEPAVGCIVWRTKALRPERRERL